VNFCPGLLVERLTRLTYNPRRVNSGFDPFQGTYKMLWICQMRLKTVVPSTWVSMPGQAKIRALDNFSTRGVCHFQCARARCIWLPFIDFGDRQILNTFKVIRYIWRHLESYSCIIRWIKRIRGVISTQKTYLTTPTSSRMRFWHFKCVKYANICLFLKI
jgi:hypothetical protein